mmetsp:Transcript_138937/g.443643  ORF Transcript_138937/g.443643 Transcript_138937/m.443643 type:complete len:250 (-) Transcript_138937:58-807(-)
MSSPSSLPKRKDACECKMLNASAGVAAFAPFVARCAAKRSKNNSWRMRCEEKERATSAKSAIFGTSPPVAHVSSQAPARAWNSGALSTPSDAKAVPARRSTSGEAFCISGASLVARAPKRTKTRKRREAHTSAVKTSSSAPHSTNLTASSSGAASPSVVLTPSLGVLLAATGSPRNRCNRGSSALPSCATCCSNARSEPGSQSAIARTAEAKCLGCAATDPLPHQPPCAPVARRRCRFHIPGGPEGAGR